MVDCTALERRHTEIPYRGFESLSFRQISIRCCFMQHRIFYFLQNNQAITASLCLLESQQIAFALVGVLVGTRYAKDRQATFRSPSSLSEE